MSVTLESSVARKMLRNWRSGSGYNPTRSKSERKLFFLDKTTPRLSRAKGSHILTWAAFIPSVSCIYLWLKKLLNKILTRWVQFIYFVKELHKLCRPSPQIISLLWNLCNTQISTKDISILSISVGSEWDGYDYRLPIIIWWVHTAHQQS